MNYKLCFCYLCTAVLAEHINCSDNEVILKKYSLFIWLSENTAKSNRVEQAHKGWGSHPYHLSPFESATAL